MYFTLVRRLNTVAEFSLGILNLSLDFITFTVEKVDSHTPVVLNTCKFPVIKRSTKKLFSFHIHVHINKTGSSFFLKNWFDFETKPIC